MNDLRTGEFWKAAAIRAVWTFAQTLLAILGVVEGVELFSASFLGMFLTALAAAVVSLLKSIVAGIPEAPK